MVKENPVLALMNIYRMKSNSESPREKLLGDARRAYCSRIAGLKRVVKEMIEHRMNVTIEEDARSMFDPSRFQNAESQRAFLAGNLNLGDMLIQDLKDIFDEHLGNVEEARTSQPTEKNLIPKITEDSVDMEQEQGNGLQMDIFGMVNNIKDE